MNIMNAHQTATTLKDRFGRSRVGNYMHTASGAKYWPFDPRAEEVDIEVIAHQLAGQNRWQGAVRHPSDPEKIFYSVAEHSVYCAIYIANTLNRPDLALEALLHDASEAYIGDLIRPLKYNPEFRAPFLKVELLNERVIAQRFNLVDPLPPEVKAADDALADAEFSQIVPKDPNEEWSSGIMRSTDSSADIKIAMLSPYEAKQVFLAVYDEIMRGRAKYRPLPPENLIA